jgi:broad specificity phosphatase PhoE
MINKKSDLTTIYVVRHGESESNVYAHENPDKAASHFGEFGASLTKKGSEQAKLLAQRLQKVHFSAFFSSDLHRAKETAEIVAKNYNLPIQTDRALRERSFGEPMSNKKKKEIETRLKKLNDQEKFSFKYFPNGESIYDIIERFKKSLKKIISEHKNETILIVSHGYVLRAFLIAEHFMKFDELPPGAIRNAAYFVVTTDGTSFNLIEKHGITKNRGYDNEE